MAQNIFEQWNKSIDTEGLQADIKEAEENGGSTNYEEVPVGEYEVKIEKMEIKATKKGDPMFSAWFRIIAGDHEKQMIFMNQVITEGFQIGIVNKFLKSLDAVDESVVEFKDYAQYNNMIMDVMEEVEKQGLEYLLDYGQTKKGFSTFTVKEVFEK